MPLNCSPYLALPTSSSSLCKPFTNHLMGRELHRFTTPSHISAGSRIFPQSTKEYLSFFFAYNETALVLFPLPHTYIHTNTGTQSRVQSGRARKLRQNDDKLPARDFSELHENTDIAKVKTNTRTLLLPRGWRRKTMERERESVCEKKPRQPIHRFALSQVGVPSADAPSPPTIHVECGSIHFPSHLGPTDSRRDLSIKF